MRTTLTEQEKAALVAEFDQIMGESRDTLAYVRQHQWRFLNNLRILRDNHKRLRRADEILEKLYPGQWPGR